VSLVSLEAFIGGNWTPITLTSLTPSPSVDNTVDVQATTTVDFTLTFNVPEQNYESSMNYRYHVLYGSKDIYSETRTLEAARSFSVGVPSFDYALPDGKGNCTFSILNNGYVDVDVTSIEVQHATIAEDNVTWSDVGTSGAGTPVSVAVGVNQPISCEFIDDDGLDEPATYRVRIVVGSGDYSDERITVNNTLPAQRKGSLSVTFSQGAGLDVNGTAVIDVINPSTTVLNLRASNIRIQHLDGGTWVDIPTGNNSDASNAAFGSVDVEVGDFERLIATFNDSAVDISPTGFSTPDYPLSMPSAYTGAALVSNEDITNLTVSDALWDFFDVGDIPEDHGWSIPSSGQHDAGSYYSIIGGAKSPAGTAGDHCLAMNITGNEFDLETTSATYKLSSYPVMGWKWYYAFVGYGSSEAEGIIIWILLSDGNELLYVYNYKTSGTYQSYDSSSRMVKVLRNGDTNEGEWVTEQVNLLDDYEGEFGSAPTDLSIVSIRLMVDNDNAADFEFRLDEIYYWGTGSLMMKQRLVDQTGASQELDNGREITKLHFDNERSPALVLEILMNEIKTMVKE
ncbi:MAG: DUF3047 domain-containing protein, partial [Candidatus Hodarchaeales archaeon]